MKRSQGFIFFDTYEFQDFGKLVNEYLLWLAERNYSEDTVGTRRLALGQFMYWSFERGLKRPQEVNISVLERYQRHLYYLKKKNGQPLSFRTQQSKLSSLRAFFKWLRKKRYIAYNPAADLMLPRDARNKLPRQTLSIQDIEEIMAQVDLGHKLGLRDRAILETFYSTGMRRSELIRLKIYDFSREKQTVFINQGKGKKDRVVPIGKRAIGWIERYLEESRPKLLTGLDQGALFLTKIGEPFSPHSLSTLCSAYLKAAGKKGAIHIFRHSMATLMLENGADIRSIQEILGHAKLETTQIYTQVSIKRLRQVHAQTHPAEKI